MLNTARATRKAPGIQIAALSVLVLLHEPVTGMDILHQQLSLQLASRLAEQGVPGWPCCMIFSQYRVVEKPSEDSTVTSVEVFDANNEMIVQFFGKRKPGMPEPEAWRELVGEIPN